MAKTASKAKKRKPKSYRMMFRFWMDGNKDDELAIADYCEEQKSKRSFTSTMRDALRLIMDLRQQRLDVLFELFPFVNAWLEERAEVIANGKNKSNNGDDGGGNIIDLSAKIERLESLLLSQASGGSGLLMLAKNAQLRALPAPQTQEPDSRIEIKRAANSENVVNNYLRSLTTAGGVNFAPAKLTDAAPGGIKKLAVAALALPSFDDEDDGVSLFG